MISKLIKRCSHYALHAQTLMFKVYKGQPFFQIAVYMHIEIAIVAEEKSKCDTPSQSTT
jgi:hypothetical protein